MANTPETQSSIEIGKYKSIEDFTQDLERNSLQNIASKVSDIYEGLKKKEGFTASLLIETLKEELDENEEIQIKDKLGDKVDNIFDEGLSVDEIAEIELQKQAGSGDLNQLIQGSMNELSESLQGMNDSSKDSIGKIESFFGVFDNIEKWWEKLKTGFAVFLWSKAPSLASFLGIEDPKEKLKQQAQEKIDEEKNKAQEKAKNLQEITKENTQIGYNIYSKIYFKLFRSSSEITENIEIKNDIEDEIARCIFEHESFQSLKYNNLKDSKYIDYIYDNIKNNLRLDEKYKNPQNIKRYIGLIFKSITGGKEETINYGVFRREIPTVHEINRGNHFLKSIYPDIDEKNPSMQELFSNLNYLGDFQLFGDESNGFDLDGIADSLKGKITNIYSNGMDSIKKLDEESFDQFKGKLHHKLQNIQEFKMISTSILGSSDSRNLENNFYAEGVDVKDKKNKILQDFIGEKESEGKEATGLIHFGNEIYEKIFKKGELLGSSTSVEKKDLTLSKVYNLFLITGGETDISKLSPIQKVNLTLHMMISYGTAKDLGSGLGDLIGKIGDNKVSIDKDVKNILLSIGKAAMNLGVDATKAIGGIAWGFAEKQPALAAGIFVLLLKFPFFAKRRSIL